MNQFFFSQEGNCQGFQNNLAEKLLINTCDKAILRRELGSNPGFGFRVKTGKPDLQKLHGETILSPGASQKIENKERGRSQMGGEVLVTTGILFI